MVSVRPLPVVAPVHARIADDRCFWEPRRAGQPPLAWPPGLAVRPVRPPAGRSRRGAGAVRGRRAGGPAPRPHGRSVPRTRVAAGGHPAATPGVERRATNRRRPSTEAVSPASATGRRRRGVGVREGPVPHGDRRERAGPSSRTRSTRWGGHESGAPASHPGPSGVRRRRTQGEGFALAGRRATRESPDDTADRTGTAEERDEPQPSEGAGGSGCPWCGRAVGRVGSNGGRGVRGRRRSGSLRGGPVVSG